MRRGAARYFIFFAANRVRIGAHGTVTRQTRRINSYAPRQLPT